MSPSGGGRHLYGIVRRLDPRTARAAARSSHLFSFGSRHCNCGRKAINAERIDRLLAFVKLFLAGARTAGAAAILVWRSAIGALDILLSIRLDRLGLALALLRIAPIRTF